MKECRRDTYLFLCEFDGILISICPHVEVIILFDSDVVLAAFFTFGGNSVQS